MGAVPVIKYGPTLPRHAFANHIAFRHLSSLEKLGRELAVKC